MISYEFKTYEELFFHITNNFTNKHFLNYLKDGKYVNISVKEFELKVKYLSLALKSIGIKKDENVAIFAKSSPFWLIFDFALQLIGARSVPIFSNISSKNLNFEIEDSNIKYIFIDSKQRVDDISKELTFITLDYEIGKENFFNFDNLIIKGEKLYVNNDYKLKHLNINEEELFSIIYTSGNTGTPKGVQLTHKNIICQLYDINTLFNLDSKQSALSLLPLAHIYERAVMSYYLSKGMSIYFVDEIENVSNLLKIVKPTTMTVVPRLLEKIFFKIQENISNKPLISKLIGKLALNSAMKAKKKPLLYSFYDKLVYSKLRDIFGGRINQLVCGGAALDKDIYQFFINIGINLYQGYGLTEFSPVIATNTPKKSKIGSVGQAMPSVQVKLSAQNELLAKGPSLMLGYLNQDKLTNETIIDGWLHTGDIANIDDEGYIFIKQRKKEIVKTSTGEYVSSVQIEQKIAKNRYIEFAVIIANNKKFVTALLFVNKDIYNNSNSILGIEKFYNQEYIKKSIEKRIKKINKDLNKWERVVNYTIITSDISIETGELTPSMKICKNVIEQKYADVINQMYEGVHHEK